MPSCTSRFKPCERHARARKAPAATKNIALTSVAVLALTLAVAPPAAAQAYQPVDWSLSGGVAAKADVKKLGVIAGFTRAAPLWQGDAWRLRLRHEIELAGWHVPKARDLIEFGYSPVLRLERPLAGGGGRVFFVEGSIGARLLSHTRVSPERSLSTAFQFSDVLGVGLQWGREARSTLGLRYQHLAKPGHGFRAAVLHAPLLRLAAPRAARAGSGLMQVRPAPMSGAAPLVGAYPVAMARRLGPLHPSPKDFPCDCKTST